MLISPFIIILIFVFCCASNTHIEFRGSKWVFVFFIDLHNSNILSSRHRKILIGKELLLIIDFPWWAITTTGIGANSTMMSSKSHWERSEADGTIGLLFIIWLITKINFYVRYEVLLTIMFYLILGMTVYISDLVSMLDRLERKLSLLALTAISSWGLLPFFILIFTL